MMLDDAGFDRNDKVAGREPVQRKEKSAEQLYDREVPLNGVSGHGLLHDWLDGEVDVMRASEVEGKSKVELWTRINAESEMLRHRVTPVHVQQRIMASLPDTPVTQVKDPSGISAVTFLRLLPRAPVIFSMRPFWGLRRLAGTGTDSSPFR